MSTLTVKPLRAALRGTLRVPSDKSISHRALIFAALSAGRSRLSDFSYGEDNVSTLRAMRAMGVSIDDDGAGTIVVDGVGLDGLREAADALDCGNSGTTMRLFCGLLGAQPFRSRLVGDASLSGRPMLRVAGPLRQRGALITGKPHPTRAGDITAPLEIGPMPAGRRLSGIEYAIPMSSAQVKTALLLSGLYADGTTTVSEPVLSRDHTERMLPALGIPLRISGTTIHLEPPGNRRAIEAFDVALPGDLSAAAFPLVAAALTPESAVRIEGVGINPTRTGICDILKLLGANLAISGAASPLGEPIGTLAIQGHGQLQGGRVFGEIAVRAIDEIPIACALAARARGKTEFCDVGELRVKESDRIATMAMVLRAFGVTCDEQPDGMAIQGRPEGALQAARIRSHGDHRIAMTSAVLGLFADGETHIEDADCIMTSFPGFHTAMRQLGAEMEFSS
jgi:3-phosphoshikimate 1-carboxyvinyltransferase